MTVGELKLKFSADLGNFKKELTEATNSTKNVSKALKDLDGDIKRALQSSNKKAQKIGKALESEKKKYESASASAKQYADKVKELGQKFDLAKQKSDQMKGAMNQQQQKVDGMKQAYQKMSKVMSDMNINTSINEELSRLQGILDKNKTKALELENGMKKLSNSNYKIGEVGGEFMSYEQMANALDKVDKESEQAYNRLNQLKEGVKGVSPELVKLGDKAGLNKLNQAITQQSGKLNGLKAKYQQAKISMDSLKNSQTQASAKMQQAQATMQSTQGKIMTLRKQLGGLSSVTQGSFLAGARAKISQLGSALKSGATKVGSFGKKLLSAGRTAGTVLNKFNFLGKGIKGLGNKLSQAGQKFSQTMRMMKSMVLSMAVMQIFQTVTEGFKSLAGQSDSFNQQMSSIYSSVSYLKNSIIACFSNVLGAVTPIITNIVNVISSAFNKLGELLASLSGKSSYTKAVYQQKDYNASVNESAEATDKATDSAKNYQKTVAGFDQITKLDSQNSSSSNSGSSSGADSNAGAWTTETVNVTSGIADSIKNGDWAGVGQAVAEKLNSAMDSIDWNSIQTKVNNGVKNVTDTLNGFVTGLNWELMGSTIGNGINTVLGGIRTFVDNFNWTELGTGISNSIKGLFDTGVLTQCSTVFTSAFEGIFETIGSIGRNSEMWNSLATDVSGAINNVFSMDFSTIAKNLSDGVSGALGSIVTVLQNIDFSSIGTSLANLLTGINWGEIFKNVSTILLEALGGLIDTILAFVLNTDFGTMIKDAFHGIAEAIRNVDLGEMLGKLGATILTIIAEIPSLIINALSGVYDIIGAIFESLGLDTIAGFYNGISDKLSAIGTWLKENVFDPVVNGFKKLFGIHSPSTVFAELGGFLTEGLYNGIKKLWGNITDFFSTALNKIKTTFTTIWNNIKTVTTTVFTAIRDKITGIVTAIKDKITSVFNTIKSKVSTIFNGVKKSITTIWTNIKTSITTSVTNIRDKVVSVFTAIKTKVSSVWNGLWGNLKKTINSIIGGVESMANAVIKGINTMIKALNKLKFDIPDWVPALGGKTFGFNLKTISTVSIPRLKNGGFPDGEDGLFYANHNEMVGTFSNGKTAVANNDQIVAGISQGVYGAVRSAMSENRGNSSQPIYVYVGGKQITDYVVKDVNNRTKSTGRCPIYV